MATLILNITDDNSFLQAGWAFVHRTSFQAHVHLDQTSDQYSLSTVKMNHIQSEDTFLPVLCHVWQSWAYTEESALECISFQVSLDLQPQWVGILYNKAINLVYCLCLLQSLAIFCEYFWNMILDPAQGRNVLHAGRMAQGTCKADSSGMSDCKLWF